jgi:hypothetical protein
MQSRTDLEFQSRSLNGTSPNHVVSFAAKYAILSVDFTRANAWHSRICLPATAASILSDAAGDGVPDFTSARKAEVDQGG